jgi:hypothetical protein
MISEFLAHVLQGVLKDTFPKFAYWLFYSEMAFALLIGVLFCFAPPVGPLVGLGFFFYASLCWIGACNYGKKKAREKNIQWEPSRFDRAVAVFWSVGLVAFGALLFLIIDAWAGRIGAAGLILLGAFNLKKVLSGKWIAFP